MAVKRRLWRRKELTSFAWRVAFGDVEIFPPVSSTRAERALNVSDSELFTRTLRHDLSCEGYNPNFRQFLHVSYKIAAEMGSRYLEMLKSHEDIIARNVTHNIYERHIKSLFM